MVFTLAFAIFYSRLRLSSSDDIKTFLCDAFTKAVVLKTNEISHRFLFCGSFLWHYEATKNILLSSICTTSVNVSVRPVWQLLFLKQPSPVTCTLVASFPLQDKVEFEYNWDTSLSVKSCFRTIFPLLTTTSLTKNRPIIFDNLWLSVLLWSLLRVQCSSASLYKRNSALNSSTLASLANHSAKILSAMRIQRKPILLELARGRVRANRVKL